MWTCNRLDLESLGSWPTMPKIFPGTAPNPKFATKKSDHTLPRHISSWPACTHECGLPDITQYLNCTCLSEVWIFARTCYSHCNSKLTHQSPPSHFKKHSPHALHSQSLFTKIWSSNLESAKQWSWVELSWTDRSGPEGFELSAEFCVCFYLKCAVAMAGESGKLQVFWDPHSQPSRAVVLFCRWVKNHRGKTRLSWSPLRQGWGWCA